MRKGLSRPWSGLTAPGSMNKMRRAAELVSFIIIGHCPKEWKHKTQEPIEQRQMPTDTRILLFNKLTIEEGQME